MWELLFTHDEIQKLSAFNLELQARAATVAFSAKEAFYKCQFPLTESWIDFLDVAVDIFDQKPGNGAFRIRPIREIPAQLADLELSGRFLIESGIVVTGISFRAVR
jgi:4'-phosphopantetheinyl transferase EntD